VQNHSSIISNLLQVLFTEGHFPYTQSAIHTRNNPHAKQHKVLNIMLRRVSLKIGSSKMLRCLDWHIRTDVSKHKPTAAILKNTGK